METRFKRIRNILIAILVLNWIVSLVKIIYGHLTNCGSMAADGLHSFSDGASNIIGVVAISIAARPADKDHPYGHRKYETFASIAISILLFLIAFNLIRFSMHRLFNPIIPEVNLMSFGVMILTIVVNCSVFFYERVKSKELKSDILFADAEHTRTDILVSISVLFTLLAVRAGFPMIDTIVSFVIAVFIGRSAINIMRASSNVLCDRDIGNIDL